SKKPEMTDAPTCVDRPVKRLAGAGANLDRSGTSGPDAGRAVHLGAEPGGGHALGLDRGVRPRLARLLRGPGGGDLAGGIGLHALVGLALSPRPASRGGGPALRRSPRPLPARPLERGPSPLGANSGAGRDRRRRSLAA